MKKRAQRSVIALTCLALLFLNACTASQYLGRTQASVNQSEGFKWDSNKNQESLVAGGTLSKDGTLNFNISTTAVTPEAAMATALQANATAIQAIVGLLQKAIDVGLAAGTKTPIK